MCDGFCAELVVLSPKFHDHRFGELVELSVNWTVSGCRPDVGVPVKLTLGGAVDATM